MPDESYPAMARVLIISTDIVGPAMAGPGIRAWELARALSAECTVTLAAPGSRFRQAEPRARLWIVRET